MRPYQKIFHDIKNLNSQNGSTSWEKLVETQRKQNKPHYRINHLTSEQKLNPPLVRKKNRKKLKGTNP